MSSLASGTVREAKSIIYRVQGTNGVIFEKIAFSNAANQAGNETVELYVKREGEPSRFLRQWELPYHASGEYIEPGEELSLSNGDVLEAVTTTADMVDYFITGVVK